MWLLRRWAIILWAILIALAPASPVLAAYVDISVFAKGLFAGGLSNFTIIYISETELDFTWGYTGNATTIMIRGKYGSYPANIANNLTAPTDGYLVYTGTATSANDTSMDFDANPGPIYYRAWAWSPDKGWNTEFQQGWKESAIVTMIVFFGFALVLSWISARSTYWILKIVAGFSWWGVFLYWYNNPPATVTHGSAVDVVVTLVLIGMGLAMMLMPFWFSREENGRTIENRFRMPFEREEEPEPPPRSRADRLSDYRYRVNGAVHGRIAPRR